MAVTRAKKALILKDLARKIGGGVATAVFVNFRGLSVGEMNSLRKTLRGQGIGFTVTKKTLLRRILADQNLTGEIPNLSGELAFAYGPDPLSPARELKTFERKNKDKLKILGGIFESRYVDVDFIAQIAAIPDRRTLYGQLASLLLSPLRRLAFAVSQISKT